MTKTPHTDEHDCPYCGGIIDLKDWSPYTSEVREMKCPVCDRIAAIEWDDDNGWFAWLSQNE